MDYVEASADREVVEAVMDVGVGGYGGKESVEICTVVAVFCVVSIIIYAFIGGETGLGGGRRS